MKLKDLIDKADHIEINMERVNTRPCSGYGSNVWCFEIDEGLDSWYIDVGQDVELTAGGCVTATCIGDGLDSDEGGDEEEDDRTIEICFVKHVSLTMEDFND